MGGWGRPGREQDWFEGRSPDDSDLREAMDDLFEECERVEHKLWNSAVRFSAQGITGAMSLYGHPSEHSTLYRDALRASGADAEIVLAAFIGAQWLSRQCERAALAHFAGESIKEPVGQPIPPNGAQVTETSRNDVADLMDRVAKAPRDQHAEKWLRGHLDRTAISSWTLLHKSRYVTARVDGRGLPAGLITGSDTDLARKINWAMRAGGLEGQAWTEELIEPVIKKAPLLSDYLPGASGFSFDLKRGVEDWPREPDPLDQRERDRFLPEVRLERIEFHTAGVWIPAA